jgi:hypothetical protein
LFFTRASPKGPHPTPGAEAYNADDVMFWHDLVHDGIAPFDKEHNFGMLRADLSPKLAFAAASMLAPTPGGSVEIG